ncbi:hypothetical protein AB6A40_002159 [Gnathostoma spinigerum]|uniref:SUN domain-containing protein n=1 Tax=Gnathostoma spinigerum TaxID=75299 RepID=A0ABD6EGK7_9BILA
MSSVTRRQHNSTQRKSEEQQVIYFSGVAKEPAAQYSEKQVESKGKTCWKREVQRSFCTSIDPTQGTPLFVPADCFPTPAYNTGRAIAFTSGNESSFACSAERSLSTIGLLHLFFSCCSSTRMFRNSKLTSEGSKTRQFLQNTILNVYICSLKVEVDWRNMSLNLSYPSEINIIIFPSAESRSSHHRIVLKFAYVNHGLTFPTSLSRSDDYASKVDSITNDLTGTLKTVRDRELKETKDQDNLKLLSVLLNEAAVELKRDLQKQHSSFRRLIIADVERKVEEMFRHLRTTVKEDCKVSMFQKVINSSVQQQIDEAIARYDADKTGFADYALESSGATVIKSRSSHTYKKGGKMYYIFGIPIMQSQISPQIVIQGRQGLYAGECWPFEGSSGYITVQLSAPVDLVSVSYEHILAQSSPYGHINSAPRLIEIVAYRKLASKSDDNTVIGHFEYLSNGSSLQIFKIQESNKTKNINAIEFRVLTNYGSAYTCLYRFRVHGRPTSQS